MNDSRATKLTAYALSAVVFACVWLAGCAETRVRSAQPAQAPPTTEQGAFVDAIATIKHSIAPVVCVQTHPMGDWDLISVEGTAVFVAADGSFITPKHVLDALAAPNRTKPCPTAAVYVPEAGNWRADGTLRIHYALFNNKGCSLSANLDIGLCTLIPDSLVLPDGRSLIITPAEFDASTPPDGTPVAFSGFPLSNPIPISAIGSIASYQNAGDLGIFTVIVDRGNWPGASGSPIYLPDGRVIGIVLARGTGDGIGLTYGRVSRVLSEVVPTQARAQH